MQKFPILDIDGKEAETMEVPEGLFTDKVNTDVIHQVIVMYQASQRQGTASTKTRSEVSGGGRKPWRQKGTGRARQGSTRSPLWKHGGIIFGPKPRDFGFDVPKQILKTALRECLNAKYQSKDLFCVIDLKSSLKKTKEFAAILKNLSVKGKTLALLDGSDASIERVSRNIASLNLMRSQDVNAYDILKNQKVLMTKTAFKKLLTRIK